MIVQYKQSNILGVALLLAEDLSERQNLSITVPHWHSWSLFAAQTTQDGSHRFVLVHYLSPHGVLCQVLLRSVSAHSIHVFSLFVTSSAVQLSDFFMRSFLSALWQRETDCLHAVDLHKWQVKLRNVWLDEAGFQLRSQLLFITQQVIPDPVCLCACGGTWGSSEGECPIPGWDLLSRLPGEQTERDLKGSWHMSWTYKWEIYTWTCPPQSPIHLKRQKEKVISLTLNVALCQWSQCLWFIIKQKCSFMSLCFITFRIIAVLAEVGAVQGARIRSVWEKSFCTLGAHAAPKNNKEFQVPPSLWNNKLPDLGKSIHKCIINHLLTVTGTCPRQKLRHHTLTRGSGSPFN